MPALAKKDRGFCTDVKDVVDASKTKASIASDRRTVAAMEKSVGLACSKRIEHTTRIAQLV